MADYRRMYLHLFNRVTDAVALLQQAQRETEALYIQSAPPDVSALPARQKKRRLCCGANGTNGASNPAAREAERCFTARGAPRNPPAGQGFFVGILARSGKSRYSGRPQRHFGGSAKSGRVERHAQPHPHAEACRGRPHGQIKALKHAN